jgi:high affinity sulfate transporter 1
VSDVTSAVRPKVPGVVMLRTYRRAWLSSDLVAGVVLATILVPQGMAYAELAGLPAVTGLYTTIACLVGYALMGPSRVLVLGPDSSLGPMIFAAITPLLAAGAGPDEAIALAGMLALLVGAIEIGLGLAKLGVIADLLSKEVQVGYMNGLALTIVVGQLPKLFGFSTDADGFVAEVRAFVDGVSETNETALLLGGATLAVLFGLPQLTRKVPAVLVAVVGATVAVTLFDLTARGVAVVGELPQGLPTPSMPFTSLDDLQTLLAAAAGIVFVSLADTIATSSSFAAKRGEEVDPNQEMIGIGSANIAAGFFQGFAVSTSGSRTAVAEQTGSKTQVTGLVGAGVVTVMLLFVPGLVANLPQTALAAVVIAAAITLVDLGALRRYARVRKGAFVISIVASLGVVLFGVLEGILIAVALAVLLFFRRNWWPHGSVLGYVSRLSSWHALSSAPDGAQLPGVVVFRWEAPLFFANSGLFRSAIRELVRETPDLRWIVLQCEAITDIDVTAADVLRELDAELNAKGIHLAFAELRSRLQERVLRYGLFETLDRDHFYATLETAIDAVRPSERDPGDQRP